MIICYHEKGSNGWEQVAIREHDSKLWTTTDQWAIDHLLTHGSMVLTMGHSMWEVKR
jgi:hypothetical protein